MRIENQLNIPDFWFAVYGSREEQDRLEAAFRLTEVKIVGESGNTYFPKFRIIEIPNSPLSIAVAASHHRYYGTDGVWFRKPYFVRSVKGKFGSYESQTKDRVKGEKNLAHCQYLVAQVLLKEGFIDPAQALQFGGEFVARPQASIVQANIIPAAASQIIPAQL